jgi:hypothetical protein
MQDILLWGYVIALGAIGWLLLAIAVARVRERGCTRKSWLDQDISEGH